MPDTTPCGQLYKVTLELVQNRPRPVTYEMICQATSLEINWLRNFASGKSKNPSVHKVELLYTHLSGKTLGLE